MSDTESKNPDPTSGQDDGSEKKEAYSLEDLDKILEAEQPGFNESLKEIQSEPIEDASSIEGFGVEVEDGADNEDEGPPDSSKATDKFKNLSLLKRKFFAFWERFSFYMDKKKLSTINRLKLLKDQLIQFFRHDIPDRIKYYKSRLLAQFKKLGKLWEDFKELSRLSKLAVFIIIFCFIGSIFLLKNFLGGGLLPRVYQPLMKSFSENANFVRTMDENEAFIDFFKAFPHLEFQVLMPRVVVNFRRDGGSNTMGAFEFYLSLDSQNTAIEVRDREREFLDIIQRTLEGFSYQEIMSVAGNTRAKLRIRDNITAALNQGYVGAVYINTMVTYQ